jgi:4-hydroxy-2-oxoheptanedioate aldolase
MKSLKSRIRNGEAVNGCWLNLGSPVTAEMVGIAGFDWVLIDLEHGNGTEADVLHQLQALKSTEATAIVRVESGRGERISRMLDMGAAGVMVPKVNTGAEAREVIDGLRYPPGGSRGVAKMVRAAGYGKWATDYISNADDNIVGVLQIETKYALDNLDEIAAIDGVDVLFIGPSDLSMSLGIFGEFANPIFKAAVKSIVAAAQKAGKATGILIFNPDDYRMYHDMGIRFIACGSDGAFVTEGARITVEKLNAFRAQ